MAQNREICTFLSLGFFTLKLLLQQTSVRHWMSMAHKKLGITARDTRLVSTRPVAGRYTRHCYVFYFKKMMVLWYATVLRTNRSKTGNYIILLKKVMVCLEKQFHSSHESLIEFCMGWLFRGGLICLSPKVKKRYCYSQHGATINFKFIRFKRRRTRVVTWWQCII